MKYFITLYLLACSYSLLNAQEAECFEECFYNPVAICTLEWNPVCGCDGEIYGNPCNALNSGIASWVMGECSEENTCINEITISSEFLEASGTDDEPQSYADETYCFNYETAENISLDASFYWTTSDGQSSNLEEPCFTFQTVLNGEQIEEIQTVTLSITSDDCTFVHNICIQPGGGGNCMDLIDVDFGECEAIIGVSIINNSCVAISGCSTTGSDNVDYSEYFFDDYADCQLSCGSCIDPDEVNEDVPCDTVVDPVCGCDGVTYNNSCEAENWFGITSWEEGACSTNSILNFSQLETKLFPVPASDQIMISFSSAYTGKIRLIDELGRIVLSRQIHASKLAVLDVSSISNGTYSVVSKDLNQTAVFGRVIVLH